MYGAAGLLTLLLPRRRISCPTSLPWYYFARQHGEYYSAEDSYEPAFANAAITNKVAILQSCPHAKHWWMLDTLVDSHVFYATTWGYEYKLDTFGTSGVWDKVILLRDKITEELAKPAEQRLDWVLYADIDTMVANQDIGLDWILPPKSGDSPYILISSESCLCV